MYNLVILITVNRGAATILAISVQLIYKALALTSIHIPLLLSIRNCLVSLQKCEAKRLCTANQ